MTIRQVVEFKPVENLHMNGNATQGENIADLVGILLGVDAVKKTEQLSAAVGCYFRVRIQHKKLSLCLVYHYKNERTQIQSKLHRPATCSEYLSSLPFAVVSENGMKDA